MEILKIAAVILISSVFVSALSSSDKSFSVILTLSASVLILFYILSEVSLFIEQFKTLSARFLNNDFSVLLKAMGISVITQFVADIASDSGNKALANQMILTGKVSVMILAMPVFVQIMNIIGKLLE